MLKDEGQHKINDDWRTYRKKTEVDKIHPYASAFDTQFFSQPGANTKSMLLKPRGNFLNHKL